MHTFHVKHWTRIQQTHSKNTETVSRETLDTTMTKQKYKDDTRNQKDTKQIQNYTKVKHSK